MPTKRDQRPNNVRYYAANRVQEIERVCRRQKATTEFLRDLRRVPCADCGRRFEPWQMEFDHRDPTKKSFDVGSGRAMLKSRASLLAEVEKCDVVCTNCHRVRTRARHRLWLAGRTPSTARYIENHRRVWRRNADLLDQLRSVPCIDCGDRFPPCSMDFDHRPGTTKVSAVSRLINGSYEVLMAEVAKCDIVCANCHRLRTFNRRAKQAA